MANADNPETRTDGADETVITVGIWPAVLIVGIVIALVAGYYVARNRSAPPTTAAADPVNTQGNLVVGAPTAIVITGGSSNPVEKSPGVVYDLQENNPLIGQSYMDIAGQSLDGEPLALADLEGQPVMLDFWATWCPPCRAEMPWMEEAYQTYKDQGFEILAVDAGEKVQPDQVHATVETFITNMALTFPVLLTEDTYNAQVQYRVYGLPSSFMINRDGTIIDAHRGMYPNRATLLDRVRRLVEDTAESGAAEGS